MARRKSQVPGLEVRSGSSAEEVLTVHVRRLRGHRALIDAQILVAGDEKRWDFLFPGAELNWSRPWVFGLPPNDSRADRQPEARV